MADPDSVSETGELEEHPLSAWLRERLTGPRGRQDWDRLVASSWDQLMVTPLGVLVPPDDVVALIETNLEPERLQELVQPVVAMILPALVVRYREDKAPLGRWVPDSARGAIERVASRPGVVHEEWIRALFRQRVVEAVMADALYRGIRDFSTIMPRLFLSLTPMQRFAKIGGAGAIGKRLVDELEKRIEPEIKNYLEGGTKRALARAANFAVDHIDDEAARAFRRNVVQFVLAKSPSFHSHALSDELLADLPDIARTVAKHIALRGETKTLVERGVRDVYATYGDKAAGQVLRELGIEHSPDLKAWAAVTWPGVVSCMEAPGVRSWLDGLMREVIEEHHRQVGET